MKEGWGARHGAVVRALASHQCGPGSNRGIEAMWVEFVVGSLLCSKRFFSGHSGFLACNRLHNIMFESRRVARTYVSIFYLLVVNFVISPI